MLIGEMAGQSMVESSLSPGKTAYDLPMDEVRCRVEGEVEPLAIPISSDLMTTPFSDTTS